MELRDKIGNFPQDPGVYLMKGEGGKIIYVGKAKNLQKRVKSYFQKEAESRYQIKFLLARVRNIDFLVCQNEKEALLLENSLIKKHKPRYNISLRDDKSYVSLKLSLNHPYPALTVTRNINPSTRSHSLRVDTSTRSHSLRVDTERSRSVKKDGAAYFGPYSQASACRDTVDFIYRHFRLRTCSDNELGNRSRPCLEYQIHRCTAPCVGYVSREEYARQVEEVRLFLEGKKDDLKRIVGGRMADAAAGEKFEEAAHWRDLAREMEETLESQRVVKYEGGDQDLVTLYRPTQKGVFAVLNIREGKLIDSRFYPVDSLETDEELMEKFLCQFYLASPFVPDEILTSHYPQDVESLMDVLKEKGGKKVVLRAPKRGEKRDLLELAEANARSNYERLVKKEYQTVEALKGMQEKLGLCKYPHRIECYDVSNISGKKPVASRVVFWDGEPDKNEYRHYKIRLKEEPDDYAMMREVLERRFSGFGNRESGIAESRSPIPDLIIIDGGKGQLSVAMQVLEETGLGQIPVIGIAKGRGRGARAKGAWEGKKEEEIYLPNRKNALILKRGSMELLLLQKIRDEAHRFAITYHRKLRDKIEKISKRFLSGPGKEAF